MAWDWKRVGILVPEQHGQQFDDLVVRLYGKHNKGMRKYLYALAIRRLIQCDDKSIKSQVHELQGIEQDV